MGLPVQAKGIDPTPSTPAPKAKTDIKSATATTDKTKKTDAKVAATPPAPVKTTKVDTTSTTLTSDKATKADAKTTASTTDKAKKPDAKATASTTSSDKAKTTVAKISDKPTPATTSSSSSRPAVIASSHSSATSNSSHSAAGQRLARLTAYWSGEGDYYTGRGMSSTGVHLHDGHCAVDPRIIPYGSLVEIAGVGKYLAVDTGSAVISREAARETGHNPEERNALVIDIYFESRAEGERFSAGRPSSRT